MDSRRRRLAAFVLALAAALLAAGPALAVDAPTVRVSRVHWDRRLVDVAVSFGVGSQRLAVYANGVEATDTEVSDAAGTLSLAVAVKDVTTVRAVAIDSAQTAESTSLRIDPALYRPRWVTNGLRTNRLAGPRLSAVARVDSARSTKLYIRVNGQVVWRGPAHFASDSFRLPAVRLPGGRPRVQVGIGNAWGTRWSADTSVYNLGAKVPTASTFLLIDKSTCYLYHVKYRVVVRVYPVAVGMPGTPTPEGYFTLGPPRAASGAWGVLRMRLSRRTSSGTYATSYYIHGTNQPDSIGTWASHGCIRMYNSNVRTLAGTVNPGYLVYIRY